MKLRQIVLVLALSWPVSGQANSIAGFTAYVSGDFATALREFRPLAERGDASSQYFLGRIYISKGFGVPQDYREAEKWFRLAAEQGDAEAQRYLGQMYRLGKGVLKDYREAMKWYRLAAKQGDADTMRLLGTMYKLGKGVPQDYAKAEKWYRLAAEQGDANAQAFLGLMYLQGEVVQVDYQEAVKWFRLAAEQGFNSAQIVLGTLYKNGLGVPKDSATAYAWFSLAATQGNKKAAEYRDDIEEQMSPPQIAEGQKLSHELFKRISEEQRIVKAEVNLKQEIEARKRVAQALKAEQARQKIYAETKSWVVQMGSFSNTKNAKSLKERLLKKGYLAFTRTSKTDSGEITRLYIGPVDTRQQASELVTRLFSDTHLRGMVVPQQ